MKQVKEANKSGKVGIFNLNKKIIFMGLNHNWKRKDIAFVIDSCL
jgi:hypothetical protein